MTSGRERAVAHAALVALEDALDPAVRQDLLQVALEFTAPRPWWRWLW